MRIAVISSAYGGYDEPSVPPEQNHPAEFVFVTDGPAAPAPWRTVHEPRPHLHPRMAAKVAKCRPDLYADADVYIWMDASMQITAPDFAEWCASFVEHGRIAQIPHPERNCIEPEAHLSAQMGKYAGQPVLEQATHYLADGHPRGWGLWATGLIVYRRHAPRIIGDAWLREQMRWTYQDQLSEAPLLRAMDIRPVSLPGRLWGHDRFAIRRHRDGS